MSKKKSIRNMQYIIAYILIYTFYSFCQIIPYRLLSLFFGWCLEKIGPKLSIHQLAIKNINLAFPHKDVSEKKEILSKMWHHMGQNIAEFIHMKRLLRQSKYTTFSNTHYVEDIFAKKGPFIIYSGHIGNWEILPILISLCYNMTNVGIFYSPPKNHLLNNLFLKKRHFSHIHFLAKGENSQKKADAILSIKGTVGMLIDQRLKKGGLNVPFFGHDSAITYSLAHLAKKYKCPVIPVYAIRNNKYYHNITFSEPLYFQDTGQEKDDIENFMKRANAVIEGWVVDNPHLWLWAQKKFDQ